MKVIPLEREHLEFLRGLRNDERINAWFISSAFPLSKSAQERWFEEYIQETTTFFCIALVRDKSIGYGFLRHLDYFHRSIEAGLCIAPKCWGAGYGTALTKWLIDYAFQALGIHRVWLEVLGKNKRALHLYEKCGFQREGCLRDSVFKHGHFEDLVIMSILREEWASKK